MSAIAAREAFSLVAHPLRGCSLRPLADGEAETLGALCAAFDPYRRYGQSAGALAVYLRRSDPALFRFAIEMDGATVGVVAIRSPWLRGPFLEMLAVLPEARGTGLGRETVDWVAAQAGLIATNLWTTVSDFNDDARGFYSRLGFSEVSELPGLLREGITEILLRRRVPRL